MDVHRFKKAVKEVSRMYAPGLQDIIDIVCQTMHGRDCVTLLMEEPSNFIGILRSLYSSDDIVRLIIKMNVIKPMLEVVDINDANGDELVELLLSDAQKFKEKLSELFSKYAKGNEP